MSSEGCLGRRQFATAELLEWLSRHMQNRGFAGGLHPAQWAALRYVGRGPAGARTVTGFAHAHQCTIGTAVETISALVRKGYVNRARDVDDRRVVRLNVTAKGAALLQRDPLGRLAAAIGALPEQEQNALGEALMKVNLTLAEDLARSSSEAD